MDRNLYHGSVQGFIVNPYTEQLQSQMSLRTYNESIKKFQHFDEKISAINARIEEEELLLLIL
jgi:hypothetical protein